MLSERLSVLRGEILTTKLCHSAIFAICAEMFRNLKKVDKHWFYKFGKTTILGNTKYKYCRKEHLIYNKHCEQERRY